MAEKTKAKTKPTEAVYAVSKGKCLVTKKGIRTAGTVVTAVEFGKGNEDIKIHLEKGFLTEG